MTWNFKYFKAEEFSHPERMDLNFLIELEKFRHYINTEIIITSSNDGVHCENSYHYQNIAVDIIAPKYFGGLFNLYLNAERFNFTGIGIYPAWSHNDKKCGGLHLDKRPVMTYSARWIGVKDKKETEYYPLTEGTLKKYGVIL